MPLDPQGSYQHPYPSAEGGYLGAQEGGVKGGSEWKSLWEKL